MTTLTYGSNPELKARLVAAAREHQEADRYIQGTYFRSEGGEDWQGCAVGCTTAPLIAAAEGVALDGLREPLSWHKAQEVHAGIPEWLGHVEDKIFECLPVGQAREWPARFLEAVPVGVDLTAMREAWLRDIVLDPKRGAFAHAARALDDAGFTEQASALRDLPSGVEWRTASAASAASAAAASAAAAGASAAAYAAAASAAAASAAAYAAASAAGAWQWTADRLIHHLQAVEVSS